MPRSMVQTVMAYRRQQRQAAQTGGMPVPEVMQVPGLAVPQPPLKSIVVAWLRGDWQQVEDEEEDSVLEELAAALSPLPPITIPEITHDGCLVLPRPPSLGSVPAPVDGICKYWGPVRELSHLLYSHVPRIAPEQLSPQVQSCC